MNAGNVAHANEVHMIRQASLTRCSQAYSDADENQLNPVVGSSRCRRHLTTKRLRIEVGRTEPNGPGTQGTLRTFRRSCFWSVSLV